MVEVRKLQPRPDVVKAKVPLLPPLRRKFKGSSFAGDKWKRPKTCWFYPPAILSELFARAMKILPKILVQETQSYPHF